MTVTPSIPISSLLNSDQADNIAASIEMDISDSLNELETLSVLQSRNRIDLSELLNPMSEQQIVGDVSEEEIYNTVQGTRKAKEMMEINGGDDVVEGDEIDEINKKLTCKDALAAASVLQKYIVDMDKLFAQKLEIHLASFGWKMHLEQTQAMQPTYITDYFTPTHP
ncbi:hypothetical protein APHAL10511_002389 [Amanita phalloides]|nr:hypothetical protein APHAL10511_002389 [Amanita phalloides]